MVRIDDPALHAVAMYHHMLFRRKQARDIAQEIQGSPASFWQGFLSFVTKSRIHNHSPVTNTFHFRQNEDAAQPFLGKAFHKRKMFKLLLYILRNYVIFVAKVWHNMIR